MVKSSGHVKTPSGKLRPAGSPISDGGEMGERIRLHDWSQSLGPIADWPGSLLTSVNIMLQSPVPIVMLWGMDGIMLYNDAYSVFAGKRHPQLLGSKVLEGWPEVADFNGHVMDQILKGKTLSYKDQQLTLYRNDQPEAVSMDLNYSPIIDESGKPAGVWAIVVETTERVAAEQSQLVAEDKLRAERERLQTLFMQAPALIAVLRGPEHIFEMANPLYIKTVAPNREIIGKTMIEAIPELVGQGIIEILDTVLATGKPYVGELKAQLDPSGDGTLQDVYFNLVYQPINDSASARPTGIFVHAVEVTEQVTSRQRAEALNAQLEAVFDSLPDGLYIAEDNRITRINQRGAEALGYSSIEEVPRSLDELYSRLSVDEIHGNKHMRLKDSTLGNALRGKSIQHIGVRVTNPLTGKQQMLRTAGAPIRNKAGEIIGAVAINNDLTELYDLQKKMQKEVLRRRLVTQKAKLLKAQNDQLTEVNKTKDEFIALTSHQLRTPATGVKQYLGMLREGYAGPLQPEQREFLDRAYNSNERQLRITDAILRVAQVDMGRVTLHTQKQDLAELAEHILADQADNFKARGMQVKVHLPKQPVWAAVDVHQLRMAIDNIVDNAIKYTDDGKCITVSLETIGSKTGRLTIRDQGVGIAPADISNLFHKFARIPNTRSIAVGGTGLGLYWSKQIVELHKGTIQVKSKLGQGTSFIIDIPLKRPA